MNQKLGLSTIDQRLLNEFQQEIPMDVRPYACMAESLGISESEVMIRLQHLQESGAVSRVGAVITPNRVGVSTLAALSVPENRLQKVAQIVSDFSEVNHNYEREHSYNLWFVVTATDRDHLDAVLEAIAESTGLKPLDLPMLNDFHIDLGFELKWT